MKYLLYCFILFALSLGFIPKSQAASFTANTAAELIAAITTANSNAQDDVITLGTLDIDLTAIDNMTVGANGLPTISDDGGHSLTIEGNGRTIRRSGASSFRIMFINSGATVILNDLTLENGVANLASVGGFGGAIFSLGQLTIDNSIFRNNNASGANSFGGAIASAFSSLTLTNSSFTSNTATISGGAIFVNRGPAMLEGNTFSSNSAGDGGGVGSEGGTLTLINNTISGNTATSVGGGINTGFDSTMTMRNNTITNNTAGTNGGGIHNQFNGIVTLHNNIISGNNATTGDECYNDLTIPTTVINANSYNIFGTGSSAGGCPAGANDIVPTTSIGTILDSLASNGGASQTHALVVGSPALDAARNSNCPGTDQRGFLRGFDADGTVDAPQLGDCDIGAFEYSLQAVYASLPAVGATISLGSTLVGTEISSILEISEVGDAALSVSLASITGANAADFSVIGLPTIIGNGNAPQDIAIICSPSAAGLRTAEITFTTNDTAQPSVSYDLECTGMDAILASASISGINQVITEGNSTVNITVQLDIPAGFSSTGDITVEIVDATTGNAISGTDYAAFPNTVLTFTAPFTPGSSYQQTISVDILDDADIEGAEALALQLNTLTGAVEEGFPDTHTLVINDNDANIYAQASFAANSAVIDEAAGTLSINVELFIPAGFNLTGDVTLTISDGLAGTAASGADYAAFAPATLNFVDAPFVPGTTYTQTITLDILEDTLVEGAETVELAITGIAGPVELLSPAAFTAIINDNEIATVIVTRDGETITVTTGGGDTEFVFKTVDNPFATVGQTVTYTIRARNPKTIPLTEVVIYDVFDERLSDLTLISTSHGTGVFNGNTLTVSGFNLQPGEEALIVVSARVAALRVGETIPNAAILESPNASVHVSNLALVGANADANSGGAAQVFLIPSQLPLTGESPFWREGTGIVLLLAAGFALVYLVMRARLRPGQRD